MLTSEQLNEVKAICDQICQTLETDDEYTFPFFEMQRICRVGSPRGAQARVSATPYR